MDSGALVLAFLKKMMLSNIPTLTRQEAANRLGVQPNTVLSWARKGAIQVIHLANGPYYSEASVERLRNQIYNHPK